MKTLLLAASLGLMGCQPQLDWTLEENDYSGLFKITDVTWDLTESGSATWSATFKNTTGYTWSGERGVGLEFAVLSMDGNVLETSEGFVDEAGQGHHTVSGALSGTTEPERVRLRFIE